MKTKKQIIKYIRSQIDNLYCCMVEVDIDNVYPKKIKPTAINGYKKRIEELENICKRLEDLLM